MLESQRPLKRKSVQLSRLPFDTDASGPVPAPRPRKKMVRKQTSLSSLPTSLDVLSSHPPTMQQKLSADAETSPWVKSLRASSPLDLLPLPSDRSSSTIHPPSSDSFQTSANSHDGSSTSPGKGSTRNTTPIPPHRSAISLEETVPHDPRNQSPKSRQPSPGSHLKQPQEVHGYMVQKPQEKRRASKLETEQDRQAKLIIQQRLKQLDDYRRRQRAIQQQQFQRRQSAIERQQEESHLKPTTSQENSDPSIQNATLKALYERDTQKYRRDTNPAFTQSQQSPLMGWSPQLIQSAFKDFLARKQVELPSKSSSRSVSPQPASTSTESAGTIHPELSHDDYTLMRILETKWSEMKQVDENLSRKETSATSVEVVEPVQQSIEPPPRPSSGQSKSSLASTVSTQDHDQIIKDLDSKKTQYEADLEQAREERRAAHIDLPPFTIDFDLESLQEQSFETMTDRMIQDFLQKEKSRKKQQELLLNIKEKAIEEQLRSELNWVRQRRLKVGPIDEQDQTLRQVEQALLTRFAAERAQLQILRQRNREVHVERRKHAVSERLQRQEKKLTKKLDEPEMVLLEQEIKNQDSYESDFEELSSNLSTSVRSIEEEIKPARSDSMADSVSSVITEQLSEENSIASISSSIDDSALQILQKKLKQLRKKTDDAALKHKQRQIEATKELANELLVKRRQKLERKQRLKAEIEKINEVLDKALRDEDSVEPIYAEVPKQSNDSMLSESTDVGLKSEIFAEVDLSQDSVSISADTIEKTPVILRSVESSVENVLDDLRPSSIHEEMVNQQPVSPSHIVTADPSSPKSESAVEEDDTAHVVEDEVTTTAAVSKPVVRVGPRPDKVDIIRSVGPDEDIIDRLTDAIFFDLLEECVEFKGPVKSVVDQPEPKLEVRTDPGVPVTDTSTAPQHEPLEAQVVPKQNILPVPNILCCADVEKLLDKLLSYLPEGMHSTPPSFEDDIFEDAVTKTEVTRPQVLAYRLIFDSIKEEMALIFEPFTRCEEPLSLLRKRRLLRPPPISTQALRSTIRDAVLTWSRYHSTNGDNIDKLLSDEIKIEEREWLDLEAADIQVELLLADHIFTDILADTLMI